LVVSRLSTPTGPAIAALKVVFATVPSDGPLLIHTNLARLGIPDGATNRQSIAEAWLAIFQEAAEGREVLIPTFNYDFTSTRLYDPTRSPGQIGALSAYCAQHHAARRTLTPIFNFCVFGDGSFDRTPVADPFSPASAFGRLFERDGAVLFLGAGMASNTYVHFVETEADIGYRYLKPFPGEVIDGDRRLPVDFAFPVRPRAPGAVVYGDLGESDMRAAGLLAEFAIGLTRGMAMSARAYHDLMRQRLAEDELCLLTPSARAITTALYQRHGRPLTLATMETP
jgi:hypothetical protein